jgi:putative two-component system response regulator
MNARILIVDDELTNLKLLDRMLGAQGYTNLVLVQDPRSVVDVYRESPTDLVLLDINMPHVDGFAVLEQLHGLGDPLLPPVVVLTAQHGRDHLLHALNAGARDFITKPFDRNELLARVRNLLEVHQAHRMVHDQKSVLESMVRERTAELQETRLQVVRRLGRAAEYRDNETGNHILRMSKVSTLLAERIGWDAAACELMLHASPMHDVGKIGIPDSILLKPGRLTPAEFEVMKTHARIGAELLDGDDSDLLCLARTIALAHHERWDGSGYPHGLQGASIPQAGRIVAIADVFDALTSARPYKKPWPVDDAVAYVRDNSGRHFDPELVEHFLAALPEILAIGERFAEPVEMQETE